MNAEPFRVLHGRAIRLVRDDIDTDQIIPARFLTTTTRDGLGEHLFADWRYDAMRLPRPEFPLNASAAAGAAILVAGRNFGCGSSREHAPWALLDWGFRVVIAPSFADIFRGNANRNGLLTVALDASAHTSLLAALGDNPDAALTVDLDEQRVEVDRRFRASFDIDSFTRRCLLEGVDEFGYLMQALGDISEFEHRREVLGIGPAIDTTSLGGAPYRDARPAHGIRP